VSAFEPQLPTDPKVDMPDFMVVLRGYDRRQVEMWAGEVANQIEQERLRADEAEKALYRMQIDGKGSPSFSHLGSHVASILEEAGRSSENMLADAAERAQESIDTAEAQAAEIVKAAEQRAGDVEQETRRILDEARAEGARAEEDALQAAEDMRGQAEHDARTVLEEARDATDLIWQEAERERVTVEAETIRLEALRHRSLEQLGRVYGHLESVLDEVRAGIGRVEEEEDEDEAQAAAAARLGVEPPTHLPATNDPGATDEDAAPSEPGGDDAVLAATRPDASPTSEPPADGPEAPADGPEAPAATAEAPAPPAGPEQPALPEAAADAQTTQPGPPETTDAEDTQPVSPAQPAEPTSNGEDPDRDQEATQRLEPVDGKSRPPKPAAREAKYRR
jgi:DivIVA protein